MKLEKEVQLYDYAYDVLDFAEGFTEEEREILKQMRHKKIKLTLEVEEPILDEAERKYLNGVIRPFRDEIKFIEKKDYSNEREYLWFNMKNEPDWSMPLFEKGTMYKGMKIDKDYTLDGLGL